MGSSPEPKILQQLERLIRAWVSDCTESGDDSTGCSLAALVPYGSSSLPGVERSDLGCGTDLDLLCLVPLPISREAHFFGLQPARSTSLAARLKVHPSVRGLVPVPPPAFVPCLKFVFAGIPVDLTFCALPTEVLSSPDFDPERPHGSAQAALAADPPSARSLAAVHTTCHIRDAVPCAAVFGKLYVAVRLWAVRRGVHGKHLGFPCGVSWAVLCARVCQLSPADRSVSSLLRQFFDTYADWAWPSPVQLLATGGAADEQWCSLPRDIMPIVTPAGVAADRMNSTHTVTPATFSMFQRELKRAARVLGEGGRKDWMAPVFESSDFWQQYHTFVSLDLRCGDEQAAGTDLDLDMAALELMPGASRWLALCESLLRQWLPILESALSLPASSLHPYPIRLPSPDSSSPCWSYMFGVKDWTGRIQPSHREQAGAEFRQMAVGRAGGEGEAWVSDAMTISVRNFGQQDLPRWVPQPQSSGAADPDDGALFAYLSHASSQSAAESLAAQLRAETRHVSELEQQLHGLSQESHTPQPDDASEVAVAKLAADLGVERQRAAIVEAERDALKHELKYMKERNSKALEDCKAKFKDERAKVVAARVVVEEDLKSVKAENQLLRRANTDVAHQQQQKQQQKQKQQAQHKLKNEQKQHQAAAAAAAAQPEQSPVQLRGRKRQISIPISDVSEPDHTESERESPEPKPCRRNGKAALSEPEPEPELAHNLEQEPDLELEANRGPRRRNPKGQKNGKNKKGKAASNAAAKLATRANWAWSKRCHHSCKDGTNGLVLLAKRTLGLFELRHQQQVVWTLWLGLAAAVFGPALYKCGSADGHDHSGAGENYYGWTTGFTSCSVEEAWTWLKWPWAALLPVIAVQTVASFVPAKWAPQIAGGQSFDGDGDI